MTTHKQFLKTWSGTCHFISKERFSSLNAAAKQVVPSSAAEIIVDEKTISYQHSTTKEVASGNTLPTTGNKDPGKGKREKKSEPKDNKT